MKSLRRIIGNTFYQGYGSCLKCKIKWPLTKIHYTMFDETTGCFPLCEDCWQSLRPEKRLIYYKQLCLNWIESMVKDGYLKKEDLWDEILDIINRKWPEIKKAVLEGK